LTVRQREVLEFINDFIEHHRYPPAIRDLAEHFSISIRGAYDHLKALRKKGYVRSSEGRSRSLEVLDDGTAERQHRLLRIPLLGRVAAGAPVFAEEHIEGTIAVSDELLGTGEFFALRVEGDSMCEAGILDGDIAIVRRQEHADNGDIVVAMIQEAATLKRFFLESNRIRLQAENAAYPPIFQQDLRILGKLRAVQRAY
jgi:repressor LexA